MAQDAIGIGLIGCGTVGSGVVKLLVEQRDLYAQRLGRELAIRRVVCRAEDVGEKTAQVPPDCLTHDIDAFFDTPDMPIVAELAGGKGFALQVVERALRAGKHVVTANKALLAAHGPALCKLARDNGVSIGFEASCGGGIPFITALQHNLIANRIEALYGILNGTCNYILTQMISNGVAYDQALADAQQRGYAEADPTLDVGGGDTAHKLAVLASLAFGVSVTDQQVPCRGIDTLDLADVRWGAELGYQVKLLAIAERREDGLTLSVAPCFIDRDEPLAGVKDSFNAISVFGHAVGHTMYYGRGAGQMPTASAVVGDIMNIASGGYGSLFKTAAIWPDQQPPAQLLDSGALASRFYLRVNAMDRPGVLARIAEALGAAGISIAAVSQHEQAAGQFVPVVIITHEARAGDVASAIEQVQAMDITEGQPIAIRIVDLPEG